MDASFMIQKSIILQIKIEPEMSNKEKRVAEGLLNKTIMFGQSGGSPEVWLISSGAYCMSQTYSVGKVKLS